MKILAFYNLKTGSGKTAALVNLAYYATTCNHKVLVWDLDPQGHISTFLKPVPLNRKNRVKKNDAPQLSATEMASQTTYDNLFIVTSGFGSPKVPFQDLLTSATVVYNYIFINCPPGLGLVHEAIFTAADTIVVPVVPETMSVRNYETIRTFLQKQRLSAKLQAYFSMVNLRDAHHGEMLEQFRRHPGFLRNYVPFLTDIGKMAGHHAPVMDFANEGYAAQCFRDLWAELAGTT